MKALICDQCKSIISFNSGLTVSRDLQVVGEPDEWHFCSWNCLGQLAMEKGEKKK
ncbi:hypothetical protein H1R82_10510 [Thermoactinomyces intermedius]|jgi:hypothetical protein|uniref:Uncharacterized protein n=1 Tax=Thermoactinomyces intermedius TaxID=2024 RepID=A0A8I1AGV2_THEIN|nr:hypothetical protein [Thermoactinomyces intermedius]MBA4549256.1 hypothetical protein [Thermoactinomyces intermedius]MBA4837057.1 hypothetical protein [Thermoactinomyces intermedius]MBH8595728.1 hypothetical protein [Thermoactinomyces intermedius]